eukprot:7101546-Lingulodinium_polyedra.AAC.1
MRTGLAMGALGTGGTLAVGRTACSLGPSGTGTGSESGPRGLRGSMPEQNSWGAAALLSASTG